MNKHVWIDRGKRIDNYVPRIKEYTTIDDAGNRVVRYQSSGGGSAVMNMHIDTWAAKRRRARQTHPGKRGRP